MAKATGESVPIKMQSLYESVINHTDTFCAEHLTEEYARLCRGLAAALARKRPSPLLQGKQPTWACAIVYAIGSINFLFDKTQTPYMSAGDLCEKFGVAKSTAAAKAKVIKDALDIGVFDPRWWRPSKMAENPVAWQITVNGFIVDARSMPREIQEEAFRRGLIPYLPE